MNCSTNTMLKVGAGLAVALGAAYFVFPEAQTMILASAPFLLALICPISMGVMFFMMRGTGENKCSVNSSASAGGSHQTPDHRDAAPGQV